MNNNLITDVELLERIATSRDEEAFHLFRDRYDTDVRDSIERTVSRWKIGLNRIDPEVLHQKVFEKLWASPELFTANPIATLMTTAHNKLVDAIRSKVDQITGSLSEMVSRGIDFGGPPPETPFDAQILAEALAILEERDRPLVEDYWCQLPSQRKSYHELATLYGEPSAGSVRARISRALEKVRKHLVAKGITSSALANEIRILNTPPPVWRGVPQRPRTTSVRRARSWVFVVALFVGALLVQRFSFPPSGALKVSSPTNSLSPSVAQSSETAKQSSPIANSPARSVSEQRMAPRVQTEDRNRKSVTLKVIKGRITDHGSSGKFTVLDRPEVKQAVANWTLDPDSFTVEYMQEVVEEILPGLPTQSLSPSEPLEGKPIPSDLKMYRASQNFERTPWAYDLVGVGLNLIESVIITSHVHKLNSKPDCVEAHEGQQAAPKTSGPLLYGAHLSALHIRKINLGDGWATLHFTAVALENGMQQDGHVILRVIIQTPEGTVWGSDKIILQPPRKI